jgi:hypothetical protein
VEDLWGLVYVIDLDCNDNYRPNLPSPTVNRSIEPYD